MKICFFLFLIHQALVWIHIFEMVTNYLGYLHVLIFHTVTGSTEDIYFYIKFLTD